MVDEHKGLFTDQVNERIFSIIPWLKEDGKYEALYGKIEAKIKEQESPDARHLRNLALRKTTRPSGGAVKIEITHSHTQGRKPVVDIDVMDLIGAASVGRAAKGEATAAAMLATVLDGIVREELKTGVFLEKEEFLDKLTNAVEELQVANLEPVATKGQIKI